MTCIFCQIAAHEAPASLVYEDETCIAFLDIHPVNPGHTLIVPKAHHARLSELAAEEAGRLMGVARLVLGAIEKSGIRCEGANVFLSDGAVAGQEVAHAHLHVVPRFDGDGHRMGFSHADADPAPPARLGPIAAQIAGKLRGKI